MTDKKKSEAPEAPKGNDFTSPADLTGYPPFLTGKDAEAKGESVHHKA